MNSPLLECKSKAVLMTKSNAPKAMDGNRKKAYMEIIKEQHLRQSWKMAGK